MIARAAASLLCGLGAAALEPVVLTCVDPDATGYATFQSHNQKVVANGRGIFMTHIHSRNEEYTNQEWRLLHSVDGGQTFATVLAGVGATNPPVLETGPDDTLYLGRVDWLAGDAYVHVFAKDAAFDAEPIVLEGAAAGKYAMLLDEPRNRLYFFSHNNRFFTVDLATLAVSRAELLTDGPNALLQYPLLALADDGTLTAAWTTQQHGLYMYRDIHWLVSPDGGETWRTPPGDPLDLPVIADETGPAPSVAGAETLDVHTWLANLAVHRGKVHFMYLAQSAPSTFHYKRYDLATGAIDFQHAPVLRGAAISMAPFDGFFVTAPGGALYAVGQSEGRIACLRSADNGLTWRDHALSDERFNVYSLGGFRELTPDGAVIGAFTDQQAVATGRPVQVHFLRIPAR